MNKVFKGLQEILFFLKNLGRLATLGLSLLFSNPKMIFDFFAKLLKRLNETLGLFFVTYRSQQKNDIKVHDYYRSELVKLKSRTQGLHDNLNLKTSSKNIGFSILLSVDEESEGHCLESVAEYANLTGNNHEILISCSNQIELYSDLEKKLKQWPQIKLFAKQNLTSSTNKMQLLKALSAQSQYSHVIFARLQDWPRPDWLYRLQLSINLINDIENSAFTCAEVEFFNDTQVNDFSKVSPFYADNLPYFFMKHSCHFLCLAKSALLKVENIEECKNIFHLVLHVSRSSLALHTLPVELYQSRQSKYPNEQESIEVLSSYFEKLKLPLVLDQQKTDKSDLQFVFLPPVKVEPLIQVIVLYKDNADITKKCALHLKNQTYQNLAFTFVDNGSVDSSIASHLSEMGYEVLQAPGPFNYSGLNNLGVSQSKYKSAEAYLFLNNDVFLESEAIVEMSRWLALPDIGIVGGLLCFEDSTVQHAGLSLDRVTNSSVQWTHIDMGLDLKSSKASRLLRTVDAVTGACLLIKSDLFESIRGWDEVHYPISFSDTDLCRRAHQSGYKTFFTPYAKGVHLESKTRGYSAIEDFEYSSWLFWMTQEKHKNQAKRNHRLINL